MDSKENKQNAAQNIEPGDGLFLKGLVMAVEVINKVWEGRAYRVLKAAVTNGSRSFNFTASDRDGPLPEITPFTRISISVTSAFTDKGNVTVKGEIL